MTCKVCEPGGLCPAGAAEVASCSAGDGGTVLEGTFVTDRLGLYCMECPAGYACPDGLIDTLEECPPGTY
jgi:hypothetical protein